MRDSIGLGGATVPVSKGVGDIKAVCVMDAGNNWAIIQGYVNLALTTGPGLAVSGA